MSTARRGIARQYRYRKAALVAKHPNGFLLFEMRRQRPLTWFGFRLFAPDRGQKQTWYLGWNGKRLAKNHDTDLLHKHEPEVFNWVRSILVNRFPLGSPPSWSPLSFGAKNLLNFDDPATR
jgi:hypothetical protein